jgi:hypothetical protein
LLVWGDGLGRTTELIVQDLFQAKLLRRGVWGASQMSFPTSTGRVQPGIILPNGAQCVMETKLGV